MDASPKLTSQVHRVTAHWPTQARSVRARTAAAATLVVGLALLIGAAALVIGLRFSLTNYVRTAAQLRAEDVAEVLRASGHTESVALDDDDDVFVQVVDGDGQVVASSPNLAGEPAVASLRGGQSTRVDGLAFEDDEFVVVAEDTEAAGRQLTVLVGRNLEVVGEFTGTVVRLLLAGIPAMLIVTAVTTWRLAGRALRPVEEIRAEVEGISSTALSRRVTIPPTGDEVARLATTMNAMLERLEDAQGRQRRFVSDAGHELRSPLATIRQHAEVALAHPRKTSTGDLAEVVLAEDLRLQRLVDDLLWLARGDEGSLLASSRPVDLDDLVLEELGRLRSTSPVEVDGSGVSGGRVVGDPKLLQRLLGNLTDNAVRHAQSKVAVSLRENGAQVVLTVDDDGAGIPPDQRQRVFERFVRLDEARSRDAGGSGLGLAIAAEVATAHGGTIAAEAGPLGGARLRVHLPAAPD